MPDRRRRKKKASLAENAVPSETNTRSEKRKAVGANIGPKLKRSYRKSSLIASSTPVQAARVIKNTRINESPIFSTIDFNAIRWPITKPVEKAKSPIIQINETTSYSPPKVDETCSKHIIDFTTEQVIADDNNTHFYDNGCDDVDFSFVKPKSNKVIDEDDSFEHSRQKTLEHIVTINETHEMENSTKVIETPISISKRVSIRRRPMNVGTRLTFSHKKNGGSAIDIGKSIQRLTAVHQISSKLFDSTHLPSLSESDSPIAYQSQTDHVTNSDLNRTESSKLFESSNPTDMSTIGQIETRQSSTCSSEGSNLTTSAQNDSDIIEATNVINKSGDDSCSEGSSADDSDAVLSEMQTTNGTLSERSEWEGDASESLSEGESVGESISEMQTTNGSLNEGEITNRSLSEGKSINESLSERDSISGSLSDERKNTSKLLNEMSANPSRINSQLSNQSTLNNTSVNNNSSVVGTIAVVTVSSAICHDHSSTSLTTTTAKSQSPKISLRPRVGFDDVNLVHELKSPKASNDNSLMIVIKGGKWRRTIYDIRKRKSTNCK